MFLYSTMRSVLVFITILRPQSEASLNFCFFFFFCLFAYFICSDSVLGTVSLVSSEMCTYLYVCEICMGLFVCVYICLQQVLVSVVT